MAALDAWLDDLDAAHGAPSAKAQAKAKAWLDSARRNSEGDMHSPVVPRLNCRRRVSDCQKLQDPHGREAPRPGYLRRSPVEYQTSNPTVLRSSFWWSVQIQLLLRRTTIFDESPGRERVRWSIEHDRISTGCDDFRYERGVWGARWGSNPRPSD